MKILFIVHAEEQFEPYMDGHFHFNLSQAVFTGNYDKVYVLNSGVGETAEKSGLIPFVDQLVENDLAEEVNWSWSYGPEGMSECDPEREFMIPTGSPHEWTWVPVELRHLLTQKGLMIDVIGGCVNECLLDFEEILMHYGQRYEVVAKF